MKTGRPAKAARDSFTEGYRTNLTPAQAKAVRRLAAEHQVSEAAVIRRAVAEYIRRQAGS